MTASPEAQSPAEIEWDASQQRVIDAPAAERLLVDAGPGTGKTEVACARVAELVNSGVCQAGRIWLISFTRTAVKEIRDRIGAYLDDKDALWSVKIATVDSHVWRLHSGFSEGAKLNGSYDDSIDDFLTLLDSDEEVRAHVAETDHLIVDEAQDLVGIRADLVVALVGAMRPDAGVTVFSDEAQAIYGFSNDGEDDGEADGEEEGDDPAADRARDIPLSARLYALGGFTRVALEEVHRTGSSNLRQIFTVVRTVVLSPGEDLKAHLYEVRSAIAKHADAATDEHFDVGSPPADGAFVLFRRRAEALFASNLLCERGVRHRLRMSGLPFIIPPWIGAAFGESAARYLGRDQFEALYSERAAHVLGAPESEAAWELVVASAPGPRGSLDLPGLRLQLARTQPPPTLSSPDYGSGGPVIATIHAAKGREADDVLMLMPHTDGEKGDLGEETRIVFVGATRARNTLRVGKGYKSIRGKNLDGGRVYSTKVEPNRAAVEIGRASDFTAAGSASTSLFGSVEAVRAAQARLAALGPAAQQVRADRGLYPNFVYRIAVKEGGEVYGHFGGKLNSDLLSVARAVQTRHKSKELQTPRYLQHLWLTGARTIVIAPDDAEVDTLHEPWRSSGFVLVPMVHALCHTYFPFRSGWRKGS